MPLPWPAEVRQSATSEAKQAEGQRKGPRSRWAGRSLRRGGRRRRGLGRRGRWRGLDLLRRRRRRGVSGEAVVRAGRLVLGGRAAHERARRRRAGAAGREQRRSERRDEAERHSWVPLEGGVPGGTGGGGVEGPWGSIAPKGSSGGDTSSGFGAAMGRRVPVPKAGADGDGTSCTPLAFRAAAGMPLPSRVGASSAASLPPHAARARARASGGASASASCRANVEEARPDTSRTLARWGHRGALRVSGALARVEGCRGQRRPAGSAC